MCVLLISRMKRNNIDIRHMQILYEDNHIIAVNKESGELIQGDKSGDEPLSEKVKKYIAEKYKKPGDVFLGIVHRIDRPVSGVVVFARTSKALRRLNELFRDKEISKKYLTIVKERPPAEKGMLTAFLKKNEKQNKSYIYATEVNGSKKASLTYNLLCRTDRYYLLEIDLISGRHHQIRCQLADAGCPVKGDLKYGYSRSNEDGGISLHSWKLSFIHPVKKEKIEIIAPLPAKDIWPIVAKSM